MIILADDLGNADLGYHGSDIKTPNIDKLAMGGVRAESFYGMPVCTPARAELMTGRYAMRYGLQTLVIFPSHTFGLATDERTLPQALKDVGYQTAMVGKWHLGHADRKYWPQNRGFEHFYGNLVGEVDYFSKERGGIIDWQRDGKFIKEDGYFTTLIGNEAVNIIMAHDTSRPLFLYVASLAPHAPYQAPRQDIDAYKTAPGDEHRHTYAAMITELDTQVGRIVAALKQKNMLDNTLIIFSSDNGGATSALFATGARSPEEREESGGVELGAKTPPRMAIFAAARVRCAKAACGLQPSFIGPASSRPKIVDEPLDMVDVMPTVLALAGAKGGADHPFDGKDIWSTLASGQPSPHDDILINVEAFRGAIRKGNWKLVKIALLPGRTELFDLSKDPGEQRNVAEQFPEFVSDLSAQLDAYAKEMKPSLWIKARPAFLGAQGKTIFDPDFDVDDSGLRRRKGQACEVMQC